MTAAPNPAGPGDQAPRRLAIEHTTRYEYASPARASFNEARLRPLTEARPGCSQALLEHRVRVTPHSHICEYDDYWGSHVLAFELQRPHEVLEVVATSLVELAPEPFAPFAASTWETLRSPGFMDEYCEYLAVSEVTEPPQDLVEQARAIADGSTPDEAARRIMSTIASAMTYRAGSTGVHSTARDAWQDRQGVCQDYAQLSVGALRQVGIPARYVSGYLHPEPAAGVGVTVTGQSHAWVEYFVGGWMGFDPTNDRVPQGDHVVVGRGREYRDVKPLHGVVSQGADATLSVTVEITRTT